MIVWEGLKGLGDYYGVVLYFYFDEIWVVYLFLVVFMICVVILGECIWWGNCVWCLFGVMYFVGGIFVFIIRIGVIGDNVMIRVEDGKFLDKSYVIYFLF